MEALVGGHYDNTDGCIKERGAVLSSRLFTPLSLKLNSNCPPGHPRTASSPLPPPPQKQPSRYTTYIVCELGNFRLGLLQLRGRDRRRLHVRLSRRGKSGAVCLN